MKIFKQLGIVFAVCFASSFICRVLPFAFPESIMSMLLMLFLLVFSLITLESIKEVAEFLLANMAFFFIPAGVGIVAYYDKIQGQIIPLFAVCALTTLITFVVTAYTIMFVASVQRR